MKRPLAIILSAALLTAALTACGSKAESGPEPTLSPSGGQEINAEPLQAEEKAPLIIYRISDDEIELHFTSRELETTKELMFLVSSGEDRFNSTVQLQLERNNGELHPTMWVFTEDMEPDYSIDEYGGEMKISVDGDTLICRIEHDNIISAFDKVEIWHYDDSAPLPFAGVITDEVSAVAKPVKAGVLPDQFLRSEYDDIYFKPDSDDFIVVSYEIPVSLWLPEWFMRYGQQWAYGVRGDGSESTVMVTYLISFEGEKYLGMKVRLEYASIEEAMLAGLEFDFDLVPAEIGMPNEKTEDEQLIADYFEACDQRFFDQREETDYEVTYQGHFDQFRYFDFKALETIQEVKRLVPIRLSENSDAISAYLSSINYTAGETESVTLLSYSGNCEATTYTTKRTHKAGSDNTVPDKIISLPEDGRHFEPLTDDFAYVIKSDYPDHGDGYYQQEIDMYSFDESGTLVQFIRRLYYSSVLSGGYDVEGFLSSFSQEQLDQGMVFYDEANGVFYQDMLALYGGDDLLYGGMSENDTQKDILVQDLLIGGQHEGYYFSKP